MNKITLSMAALATLALVSFDMNTAQAAHGFGLHIGGPNVHFDIGNPHGYGYRNRVAYRTARTAYYPARRARYHYDWHDTSHYDYIPGGFVRHGNHCDYVPARKVWHQEGHWDRHYEGHRGGQRDRRHGGHH